MQTTSAKTLFSSLFLAAAVAAASIATGAEVQDGKDCSACDPNDAKNASSVTQLADYDKYRAEVIRTESGGRLGVVNQYGYMGLYQMGYPALVDAGMVQAQPGRKNNSDEYIWTDKAKAMGVNSRADFLSNEAAQTAAFDAYNQAQFSYLKGNGAFNFTCTAITDDKGRSAPVTSLGILKSAHLVGAGGTATSLRTNTQKRDGNGHGNYSYMMDGSALSNPCISSAVANPCTQTNAVNGQGQSEAGGTTSGGTVNP